MLGVGCWSLCVVCLVLFDLCWCLVVCSWLLVAGCGLWFDVRCVACVAVGISCLTYTVFCVLFIDRLLLCVVCGETLLSFVVCCLRLLTIRGYLLSVGVM